MHVLFFCHEAYKGAMLEEKLEGTYYHNRLFRSFGELWKGYIGGGGVQLAMWN